NTTSPALVRWDHGFGPFIMDRSRVTVDNVDLVITGWAMDGGSITAMIPSTVTNGGQLLVTRGDNLRTTTVGITLHPQNTPVVMVSPPPPNCDGVNCAAIQPAIDASPNGTVILIAPGVYQENVNLWKPVTLQGLGAAVTTIDLTLASGNLALK